MTVEAGSALANPVQQTDLEGVYQSIGGVCGLMEEMSVLAGYGVGMTGFVTRTFLHDAAQSDQRLLERFALEGRATFKSVVSMMEELERLAAEADDSSLDQGAMGPLKEAGKRLAVEEQAQMIQAALARIGEIHRQFVEVKQRVSGISVEELERQEVTHWIRRLMNQTLNAFIQHGRMPQGESDAFRQMGVDPFWVALQVGNFLAALAGGKVPFGPDLRARNDFVNTLATQLEPVIQAHIHATAQRLESRHAAT